MSVFTDTLDQLQNEQEEWQTKNFGPQPPSRLVMGVSEEVGELFEATADRDKDATKDAIGDIMIYLAGYCTQSGLRLVDCYNFAKGRGVVPVLLDSCLKGLVVWAGKLNHHQLKSEQGVRGSSEYHTDGKRYAIGMIVKTLESLTESNTTTTLPSVINLVWGQVKERNWASNKENGKSTTGVIVSGSPAALGFTGQI